MDEKGSHIETLISLLRFSWSLHSIFIPITVTLGLQDLSFEFDINMDVDSTFLCVLFFVDI